MQVEENVNTSNFLLIGNKEGSRNNTSKADKKNGQLDFSSFLVSARSNNTNDSSMTNRANDSCDVIDEKETELSNETISSNGKDNLKRTDAVEKTNDQSQIDAVEKTDDQSQIDAVEKTDDQKQADIIEKTDDLKLADAVETDLPVLTEKTEDDQEMVLAALGSIIQMVMEQFQLLPEEVTAKLNEFGMELNDLVTKDGIKEFFLNMESVDFSDLLINESLNQELHMFTENFLQVLDQDELTEESLESVLPGIDIAGLLAESTKLQEPVTEGGSVQSEKRLDVSEKIAEEPKVLISEQEMKLTKNMEKQPDSQKEDTSSEMTKQETSLIKDSSVIHEEKFENPILQALDDVINRVQENLTVEESVPENNIIKQIVEQIRVSMNQNSTSMELQLYPEHLGKIQINVVSKDGVMTARISAETEAAKQAIEGGLSSLKDTLEQQNLKVEAIEVMVSTAGFEQQNEQQKFSQQKNGSKSIKKLDLSGIDDDVPLDDEGETIRMMAAGSSVSYTA